MIALLSNIRKLFNRIADIGWNKGIKNGVELHKLSYESERAKTNLPSQLVCSARMKASECLKSAFALQKKAKTKVGKPNSKHCPIRYDARSATIKLAEGKASLVTIDGRQKVTFHLAKFQEHRKDWKVCSSDLCQKNGAYFLHVVVESKSPDFECSGKTTGIDLGITRPAVTSDNLFFGKKRYREIEARHFRLKRSLQAKGTKSAKRKLKKLSGKVNRFRDDCDHVLSKRIVHSVPVGTTIVLEDLTNIRKDVKARKRQSKTLALLELSPTQDLYCLQSRYAWG